MAKSDGNALEILGGLVMTSGVVLIMSAVAITVWQCYIWQRFDFWPQVAVADACAYVGWQPVLRWHGVQKIIGTILETPLTMAMVLTGLVIGASGLLIETLGRERARKIRLP